MSVSADQITIATTATLIATASSGGTLVLLHKGGAVDIFIGGSGVVIGEGYGLAQNSEPLVVPVAPGQEIYGIVAASTEPLHFLLIE